MPTNCLVNVLRDHSKFERLYTRIMKGVFEIKNSEHRDNLKPSVSSFLLKFAEDEANF